MGYLVELPVKAKIGSAFTKRVRCIYYTLDIYQALLCKNEFSGFADPGEPGPGLRPLEGYKFIYTPKSYIGAVFSVSVKNGFPDLGSG